MCLNEPPPSTVRFLADALVLNPIANRAFPDADQNSTARTPDEIEIFQSWYITLLTRNGMHITEQDREEMRLRGIPPIPEHMRRWAPDWLLDEDMRFEEPEGYTDDRGFLIDDFSDPFAELGALFSNIPITPRDTSPQPFAMPTQNTGVEEDETYASDPGFIDDDDDASNVSISSSLLEEDWLAALSPPSDNWFPEMEDEHIASRDEESPPPLTRSSSSADSSGPRTTEQVLELGDAVRIVGVDDDAGVGGEEG